MEWLDRNRDIGRRRRMCGGREQSEDEGDYGKTHFRYNARMNETPRSIPYFDDVAAAAGRLVGVAATTPLVESLALSERVGGRVFLKLETLQRTGSFKFRGAYKPLVPPSPNERGLGVVAFSSGNHPQRVPAAAARPGLPCP